jgi:hypothetical protein
MLTLEQQAAFVEEAPEIFKRLFGFEVPRKR